MSNYRDRRRPRTGGWKKPRTAPIVGNDHDERGCRPGQPRCTSIYARPEDVSSTAGVKLGIALAHFRKGNIIVVIRNVTNVEMIFNINIIGFLIFAIERFNGVNNLTSFFSFGIIKKRKNFLFFFFHCRVSYNQANLRKILYLYLTALLLLEEINGTQIDSEEQFLRKDLSRFKNNYVKFAFENRVPRLEIKGGTNVKGVSRIYIGENGINNKRSCLF